MDFGKRATENFAATHRKISIETEQMLAEHGVKGLVGSGATAKRAVQIWEQQSQFALSQTLNEVSQQIETRNRTWNRANEAIAEALEVHIADARNRIARPLKLAGASGNNAASNATDRLLREASNLLRAQLREFGQGWTAPPEKPWRERHPVMNDISLLVVGAVMSLAVAYVSGLITRVG